MNLQAEGFLDRPPVTAEVLDASVGKPIRKVLLIQPPAYANLLRSDMNPNVPLGICYVGAMLERHGFEVEILDAVIEGWKTETPVADDKIIVGLSYDEVQERIRASAPDLVGVTSMFTSQRDNAYRVAQIAKEVVPGIPVVLGGAHPTAVPEAALDSPHVDVVVLGEGDNSIVPLVRCLEEAGDLAKLDGIAYRDAVAGRVVQPKTQQVDDLDELPFPARHLVPMEKYFAAGFRHGGTSKRDRATSVITSRGCQYFCNFCTAFKVFTRTPRMRSTENVIAELEELTSRWGVNEVFFEDDQLIAKQRNATELFEEMATRFDLVWDTPNGVSAWLLNEDVIRTMQEAGCYRVNLAIESGNQDVLRDIINKPVHLKKVPEVVRLVRKYQMEVGTFLVVGNIGRERVETLEEIRDSFRFVRKLRVKPHVSYLTAYPGSDVLAIAEEKDYLIPGFSWDDLVISRQQLQTPEWSPEALRDLVERESLKTQLWVWLTRPADFLGQVGGLLAKHPWHATRRIAQFLAFAVTIAATSVMPRALRNRG